MRFILGNSFETFQREQLSKKKKKNESISSV